MPKSGFQPKIDELEEAIAESGPQHKVQFNTLQPAELKLWAIQQALERDMSLSGFIQRCLEAVRVKKVKV
jgi:hypothetical protein